MRGINTQRGRFLPLSPVNGCAEAAVSHSPLTTKDLGKVPATQEGTCHDPRGNAGEDKRGEEGYPPLASA